LFSFPASLPTMNGEALLVNDFLAHSERIYVGEGPESIEQLNGKLDFIKFIFYFLYKNKIGLLYTGLKNGSILELDPVTRQTSIVYSSLSIDDHLLDCGKPFLCIYLDKYLHTYFLGTDKLEHVCGRPLGIRRFSDNELIIVQAYHGLFKLNVKTSMSTN
jgi:hypothetical protein